MKLWRPFAPAALTNALVWRKDNASEQTLFSRRALFALAAVFIALLAVASRLVYLQVLNHERFSLLADGNRIRMQPLPPTRGFIYDRNGVLLADNLASYHLEITREQVKDLAATLKALGQHITLSEVDLERFRKLAQRAPPYTGIPLRFQLTDDEIARLAVDLHRFPGVEIKADLTRRYPLGSIGVHAIGYVGRIDANEMSKLDPGQYSGGTHIGKTGVERSYEDVLRGRNGWRQVETNADGRPLRVLGRTAPLPGQHVYLTIDIRLQAVAEKVLEDHNGAIVAIDPRSGEILALASQPIYDPNPFVNGIDFASYRALNTSKDKPLLNRALRGIYPPGSTVKPLMALAGLEHGIVNRQSTVFCPGFYRLPGVKRKFNDWKRSGHGSVSMERALAQSCDVYFYDLAFKLGVDRMHEFLSKFSMGQPTGVDLPGEKGALLPSEAWKLRVRKQPWFGGDSLSAGIGQGYFLATPLQLAHSTAVIAEHGLGFKPRVLLATEDPGTRVKTPAAPRPLPAVTVKNPQFWNTVIAGMIRVVEGGTAHKIGAGAKYRIAGKTGTAQVFTLARGQRYNARRLSKHLLDHALFVAFAPVEDPRIAIAVIAEHGGGGSATAAPLARKVMDAWLLEQYGEFAVAKPQADPQSQQPHAE